jgi:hypothetical protein
VNSLDDVTAPTCTVCHRGLYADELDAYACRSCQQHVDDTLAAIAGPPRRQDGRLIGGFYAALFGHLDPTPKAGRDGRVSGSRSPSLPIDVHLVDLQARGGPLAVLQTWVDDWASYGHAHLDTSGTQLQQADAAVKTLRFNLEWAARLHKAFDEFAREMRDIRRTCEVRTTGERPPRRIPVVCSCGTVLRITLYTAGARCPGCDTQYGHGELLDLPLDERRIAA